KPKSTTRGRHCGTNWEHFVHRPVENCGQVSSGRASRLSTALGKYRPQRGTAGQEGLAERRSSSGCDGRSEARTQGAPIAKAIGATEDAASGRAARPDGTDSVSPNPPGRVCKPAAPVPQGVLSGCRSRAVAAAVRSDC